MENEQTKNITKYFNIDKINENEFILYNEEKYIGKININNIKRDIKELKKAWQYQAEHIKDYPDYTPYKEKEFNTIANKLKTLESEILF